MTFARPIRSTFSRVALAAMLLAVQITVAGHLDLDGHSQETQCAICVSFSSLGAANVSDRELIVSVVHAETPISEQPVPVTVLHGGQHRARAPPVAS